MTALYGRVSSHDQRADLECQLARVTAWAAWRGYPVVVTEAEVGAASLAAADACGAC